MPDAFAPTDIDLTGAYGATGGAPTVQQPAPVANPTGDLTATLNELGAILQQNNMFADFTPTPGLAQTAVNVEEILSPEALQTLNEDQKAQIAEFLKTRPDPNTLRQTAYERAQSLLGKLGFSGSIQDFLKLDRAGMQAIAQGFLQRHGGANAIAAPTGYTGPVNIVQSPGWGNEQNYQNFEAERARETQGGGGAAQMFQNENLGVTPFPGAGQGREAAATTDASGAAIPRGQTQTTDQATAALESWRQSMIAGSRASTPSSGSTSTTRSGTQSGGGTTSSGGTSSSVYSGAPRVVQPTTAERLAESSAKQQATRTGRVVGF